MGYRNTNCVAPTRPSGIKRTNELSVIILCADFGYRMKKYGPKTLIKDKYGISLLENQVRILRRNYSDCQITVVGGFDIDKIYKNKPFGINLVDSVNYNETNEVEEARLGLLNCIYSNVLILFGDLYFNSDFIDRLILDKSFLLLDKEEQMLSEDIGVNVIDGRVSMLNLALMNPKWAKAAFIKDRELRLLQQFVRDRQNSKLYLFEAFNYVLLRGGELEARYCNFSANLVHLDTPKELEKI